jgi:hypothetical protein
MLVDHRSAPDGVIRIRLKVVGGVIEVMFMFMFMFKVRRIVQNSGVSQGTGVEASGRQAIQVRQARASAVHGGRRDLPAATSHAILARCRKCPNMRKLWS